MDWASVAISLGLWSSLGFEAGCVNRYFLTQDFAFRNMQKRGYITVQAFRPMPIKVYATPDNGL